ncbi:hypothetical protein RA210_U10261 [Rubrivivax sp. A210]|nr:hypothetical protein RA210_U10261 [Rubrivivax sp. A210]
MERQRRGPPDGLVAHDAVPAHEALGHSLAQPERALMLHLSQPGL